MAAWKLLAAAAKARQRWNRIPPEQRRKMIEQAGKQVRVYGPAAAKVVRERGPVIAKGIATALRNARKAP
jgi:hypothetical protein